MQLCLDRWLLDKRLHTHMSGIQAHSCLIKPASWPQALGGETGAQSLLILRRTDESGSIASMGRCRDFARTSPLDKGCRADHTGFGKDSMDVFRKPMRLLKRERSSHVSVVDTACVQAWKLANHLLKA
ncbi:hypothetical protein VTI28DRAFT_8914 [Corynascus sepedonium]